MPTFIKKCNVQKKEIKYRKLKSIDPMAFSQHLKLDGFEELLLDEMVEVLNKNPQDAMDGLAPIKSRTIPMRTMNPWFNDEARDQKRRMKDQEKKWRKYKLESNWKAFKSERSKYRQILREVRRAKIAEKVNECDNDVKKLYNLVKHLMGRNLDSPFPNSESDKMLANEFADFFMEKVKRIRDSLEVHPTYNPQATVKAFMCKFEQVTEKEVAKCIRDMASKSWELDAIPTTTLKQVLDTIITPGYQDCKHVT